MAQLRLYITAAKAAAEGVFAVLEPVFDEDGYPLGLTEIDEIGQIFEVSLYIDEVERQSVLARLHDAGVNSEHIAIETLPEIDWVRHALDGLKPVRTGKFFVHGSHDRDRLPAGALGIEIDAAQAFGTGHHGTTAGCLEMISALMRVARPRRILDLGTGSGVLAIGVAKLIPSLRTAQILASDNDTIASRIARENVALNHVQTSVHVVTATGFEHKSLRQSAPYDLIVANILARPLMKLAPRMARALASNGSVILSGILDKQREAVLAAYRNQGLFHRRTLRRHGWVTLFLRKSGQR